MAFKRLFSVRLGIYSCKCSKLDFSNTHDWYPSNLILFAKAGIQVLKDIHWTEKSYWDIIIITIIIFILLLINKNVFGRSSRSLVFDWLITRIEMIREKGSFLSIWLQPSGVLKVSIKWIPEKK